MDGIDTNYVGPMESGRYEGEGVYTYPDGTRFEGSFHNGAFHGKGKMIFANGVFNGVFRDGKEVDGEYVFNDGLKYQDKNWSYSTPADRRFFTEREADAINGAGELQYTNAPQPKLPSNCFDIGDGHYYDPNSNQIHELATKKKLRVPSERERRWIEERCRTSQ